MNGKFAEAQRRCEEAQRLADEIGDGVEKTDRDDLIFTQQNLAHALFFQGHYDEALAIYRQNWNKPQMGKTFGVFRAGDLGVSQSLRGAKYEPRPLRITLVGLWSAGYQSKLLVPCRAICGRFVRIITTEV